jgi:glycosyltransferase involved in cell wall biosynthesis
MDWGRHETGKPGLLRRDNLGDGASLGADAGVQADRVGRPGALATLPPAHARAKRRRTPVFTPGSVLVVDQSGELGGAELALLPVVAALGARCEVVLLADGPFRELLQRHGAKVDVLAARGTAGIRKNSFAFSTLLALPGLVRQVAALARRARHFELLYVNTQKALVIGALGKFFHRRPVIWHLHDIMTREHFGPLQLWIVKFAVTHCVDRVIANSHASAQALAQLTHLPRRAMRVVHNGVDARAFDAVDDGDRAILRAELGLPASGFLAGVFGRLSSWKGQHVALEATARLPDLQLVIVGSAMFGEHAYEAELRRRADELGIADRVHFVGFKSNVARAMKAMDVIVHTSTRAEPFGLVIVEGMLAGRPVIATAAGGVPEIIDDQITGLLVEPGNVNALRDAIARVRRSPELAARLSREGRRVARLRFAADTYVKEILRGVDGAGS